MSWAPELRKTFQHVHIWDGSENNIKSQMSNMANKKVAVKEILLPRQKQLDPK